MPKARTAWCHRQIQPVKVSDLVGFLSWLEGSNLYVAQRYGWEYRPWGYFEIPQTYPIAGTRPQPSMDQLAQWSIMKPLHARRFRMSSDLSVWESGAAEGTRTPDPIITNDVLYHLSYSGLPARVIAIFFA